MKGEREKGYKKTSRTFCVRLMNGEVMKLFSVFTEFSFTNFQHFDSRDYNECKTN
jgi:hypothetical protein